MEPADYRLVRSQITTGIMIAIKRPVLQPSPDHRFSYWLYGERKFEQTIPVEIPRPTPCLVCSYKNEKTVDFSLLTVDESVFQHCLTMLTDEELFILNSLLDDDRHIYQVMIQEQYQNYKRALIEMLKQKLSERMSSLSALTIE